MAFAAVPGEAAITRQPFFDRPGIRFVVLIGDDAGCGGSLNRPRSLSAMQAAEPVIDSLILVVVTFWGKRMRRLAPILVAEARGRHWPSCQASMVKESIRWPSLMFSRSLIMLKVVG